MKIKESFVIFLLSVLVSTSIMLFSIAPINRVLSEQATINEKVIEALVGLVETDHVIIEQMTTKKPGH